MNKHLWFVVNNEHVHENMIFDQCTNEQEQSKCCFLSNEQAKMNIFWQKTQNLGFFVKKPTI